MQATREELAQAVIVAAEVLGHELSPVAAKAMARELVAYEREAVSVALRRCTRELHGRMSLAAILERMPGRHLGADEAWALCPRREDDTVVWTDQIAEAHSAAAPLLAQGDQVAARMAFRDAYARLCAAEPGPPRWWASLGSDAHGRAAPISAAVEAGRLSADYARPLLLSAPGGHDAAKRLSANARRLAELLPEGSE